MALNIFLLDFFVKNYYLEQVNFKLIFKCIELRN